MLTFTLQCPHCTLSRQHGVEVYDAYEQKVRTIRVCAVALHGDYPALMDAVGHQQRGYYPSPWTRLCGYRNTGV